MFIDKVRYSAVSSAITATDAATLIATAADEVFLPICLRRYAKNLKICFSWKVNILTALFVASFTSNALSQSSGTCLEDGGTMECMPAPVSSVYIGLCNEAAAYLSLDNLMAACIASSQPMTGNSNIQHAAACFSDGLAGCPGSVTDPIQWSNPGDTYTSWFCWTITDGTYNGTNMKFAPVTGTSIYRDSKTNTCSIQGGFPQQLVAAKWTTYQCPSGWTSFTLPDGSLQCRRVPLNPHTISLNGGSTTALPCGDPVELTATVTKGGTPAAGVGVSITMDDGGTISGSTGTDGAFRFLYVPPYLQATSVTLTGTCSGCTNQASSSVIVAACPIPPDPDPEPDDPPICRP